MEGFTFPNPMSAEEIDLPASDPLEEAIRISALKLAVEVESRKGGLPSRIMSLAKEYENYIRHGQSEPAPEEFHDDDTMTKVHDALQAGLRFGYNATEIIIGMQNAGILFRERRSSDD